MGFGTSWDVAAEMCNPTIFQTSQPVPSVTHTRLRQYAPKHTSKQTAESPPYRWSRSRILGRKVCRPRRLRRGREVFQCIYIYMLHTHTHQLYCESIKAGSLLRIGCTEARDRTRTHTRARAHTHTQHIRQ